MIHGSNMTKSHRKMRKGISLVEMLIAIVLFGVISVIGYKYYKNFYNVNLSAKQARVSAIVEQATQISNAYDIYAIKKGSAPITMASLSAADIKILTETPPIVSEITTTGWQIASPAVGADRTGLDLDDDTNFNDVAFTYIVDAPTTAAEQLEYCNVLNNIAKPTWSLDSVISTTLGTPVLGEVGTESDMFDAATNNFKNIMCYTNSGVLTFAFIKTVTP